MDHLDQLFGTYAAVFAATIAGFILVVTALIASRLLAPFSVERNKGTSYECGMLPVGEGNTRLSVKFYLVAMLFILFDIEVVFLYPWAVLYKQLLTQGAALGLGSMITFLGILFVGYIYALKKGAFDWKT